MSSGDIAVNAQFEGKPEGCNRRFEGFLTFLQLMEQHPGIIEVGKHGMIGVGGGVEVEFRLTQERIIADRETQIVARTGRQDGVESLLA